MKNGRKMTLKDLKGRILNRITEVQRCFPTLMEPLVNIHEEYGLSRSFRRGYTLEALNRGVAETLVDCSNRWMKEEEASARKIKLKMRDYYSEVLVSLKKYLKYSQAL